MVMGQGPFAAIGNFDGVHLGHQFLLSETKRFAQERGVRTGVVVFEPHPHLFFRPDDPPFLLTSYETRRRLLSSHGAEEVISLTFDRELASLSPAEFVKDVLKDRLNLTGIVVGAEFRFGKGRAGDVDALKIHCAEHNIDARVVEPLASSASAGKIGSSSVREALRRGDVREASSMLGRSWKIFGIVQEGRRLGRTIGFPTANLYLDGLVHPRYGVYAVNVECNGERYSGVANFGRRPTVGSDKPLLEVHIIGFSSDVYDTRISVEFIEFIRPEKKFENVDALTEQIALDRKRASEILDGN